MTTEHDLDNSEERNGTLHIWSVPRARWPGEAVAAALRDVLAPTRQEPGCLAIQHFRSIRDLRLFYVHSRWVDEVAFETHAGLPHTVRFLERVQVLIDHPVDVTRARPLA